MRLTVKRVLFIIFWGCISSACGSATQTPLTTVTLQLGSTHQAIYAGFYAADQNGYYAQEGLALKFSEGRPDMDVVAPVLEDKAQFGAIGASAIISARAAGQPIRAVASVLRRDPVAFASLADSGITHVEDFVGKKIFTSPRVLPRLFSMLARVGLKPDQVTQVTTGDFSALYTGAVDVASGNITSDVLSAEKAGYKLNIIYPDDYGVHFYSVAIFVTDDYIAANPDLITRFLRATFRGWTYAVENPQSVGGLVLKYNPKADSAFESASMVAALPFVNTGEDHIGWMKSEVWDGMAKTMRDEGILTAPLEITDAYTMQFIQQLYPGDSS